MIVIQRQRTHRVDIQQLHAAAETVLRDRNCSEEVAVHLVGLREMARINEHFLQHPGPTDVITFDYGSTPQRIQGEIFICVAVAKQFASEYQVPLPRELGRYVIHGMLHLLGFDDQTSAQRRIMKVVENRLVTRWWRALANDGA